MYTRVFRIAALSFTTAAVALMSSGTPALAGPVGTVASEQDSVFTITDRLARQIAGSEPRALLSAASSDAVTLSEIADPALNNAVRLANRAVLAAKGLPAVGTSLLRLRLAHPDMRAALDRGAAPLVAAAPTDDTGSTVTAYDTKGGQVTLDATRVPTRPVFVVEVDTSAALPLGLSVIRTTLDAHGISGAKPRFGPTAGYWATMVRSVRLNDDKEPWIKGSAEIFGVSTGFGLDGHAKADTLTMPYLDNDGTTYYPNQLIVHFSAYKYNLADFVMMEDDGDTNYRSLAIALTSALLTIVDAGAYIPLVDAILNAMPDSWWTDDPDYVDSWYTLSTRSSGQLRGAAANGTMDIAPYWVEQLG